MLDTTYISFWIGAILGVWLMCLIITIIVKKFFHSGTYKDIFKIHAVLSAFLIVVPPLGMAQGDQIPWTSVIACYLPIQFAFMAVSLHKAGYTPLTGTSIPGKIAWKRGFARLWAIIFVPFFYIAQWNALYSLDTNLSLVGYAVPLAFLAFGLAVSWTIKGFSPSKPSPGRSKKI